MNVQTILKRFDSGWPSVDHPTEGTLFYVPPEPHDSWVVGDHPYISLHLMGAAQYAT